MSFLIFCSRCSTYFLVLRYCVKLLYVFEEAATLLFDAHAEVGRSGTFAILLGVLFALDLRKQVFLAFLEQRVEEDVVSAIGRGLLVEVVHVELCEWRAPGARRTTFCSA